MRGPLPKSAAERRRANAPTIPSTRLPASGYRGKVPGLSKHRRWSDATRRWWKSVWRSPMAAAWLPEHRHALERLALLLEEYAATGNEKLLAEIRQLEDRFGLTPKALQQLRWEVVDEEQAKDAPSSRARVADPRLKLVKDVGVS